MRKSQSYSLTEGSLLPAIVRFSIPLMLSNVLQVLFNMSDIAVVGRFAGSQALGAVGSTTILVSLFTGFLIGMGSGVNVVTARYLGARQHQDVIQTVHTSAILLLITGVLLLVFGFLFTPPMLQLLGTKDELLDGAIRYLRIYLLGMPALAVFNFGNGVLSASGDTKRPLLFLSIAGALNVALNLLFVIVFQMAEAGVALASAVSQYVSASLIVLSLAHRTESIGLSRAQLHLDRKKSRQILSISIPSGLQNAIFAIANLFIQAGVNTFDAVMVEGNAAAANADALIYDVMAAVYLACSSFMSQNYGAGHRERVKKSYLLCLGLSFGIAAVMSAVLVIFYGLHHRRIPGPGPQRGAHGHCDPGLLRVPGHLGVHSFCPFPYDPVTVFALYFQLDHYRHRGAMLFHLLLSGQDEAIAIVTGSLCGRFSGRLRVYSTPYSFCKQ